MPNLPGQDLARALDRALSGTGLRFTAGGHSNGVAVLSGAGADRSVNVFESDGSYLLSYSWKGWQQAHGATPDISAAAGSARRWVEGAKLESLAAAHPFAEFSGLQLARERGDAVEFQWAAVLDLVGGDHASFRDLVVLASGEEFLKRLFPHLGHRFALSADEFSRDVLVAVFVHRPGWFVIHHHDGEGSAFAGNARQMVDHLVGRLRSQLRR